MRFVCIDTETTGLNPANGARLIEISAVEIWDNVVNEDCSFQALVNPNVSIPWYITRINGITNEMMKNAKPLKETLIEFKKFISTSILVFQNAGFDLTFLNYELKHLNIPIIENNFIDTMEMSRKLYNSHRKHNLDAICSRLNIEIKNRHRALGDAIATAWAFVKMKKYLPSYTNFIKDKIY